MRIAGVGAASRMIWVDAGDIDVVPLDLAQVRVGDDVHVGQVLVTPEQVAGATPRVEGVLVRARERAQQHASCAELPGADMPPLGTLLEGGIVVGIDAVIRVVTVERAGGQRETVALQDR